MLVSKMHKVRPGLSSFSPYHRRRARSFTHVPSAASWACGVFWLWGDHFGETVARCSPSHPQASCFKTFCFAGALVQLGDGVWCEFQVSKAEARFECSCPGSRGELQR